MNSEYTIVIISQQQSYMILSLQKKFIEMGFKAEIIDANVSVINKIEERVGAYLLYCDEELTKQQQALIYLKDLSVEKDIPIFVVGNQEEKTLVEQCIPAHLTKGFFERPVNINDLVVKIEQYIEMYGPGSKKKILVVDDSGAMLRNVKGWLEDRYQVILANSGAMAIKYLATNRPDLVLLDYEMPVVDGKQVLEMIKTETEFSDIPVIFLTGKDDRESVMNVMALKPEGYLLKTMEPVKIIAEIDQFFEKQKAKLR